MITFVECESCAAKPGAPVLCGACLHNRDAIHQLRRENDAITKVYVAAAMLRTFPVPFDDHFQLVGAVDECRSVLEPPIDDYAPSSTKDPEISSDFSLLHDLTAQDHPAWPAFVRSMKGRAYGREALNDAWEWFKIGWNKEENGQERGGGICRYCRVTVDRECNCCAPCADERGP